MTSELSFNNLTAAQSFSLRPPLINFKVLPQTHLFYLFRRLSDDFIPSFYSCAFGSALIIKCLRDGKRLTKADVVLR